MSSCGNEEKAPDVSDVKVETKSRRLDRDLAAIDTTQVAAGLQRLQQKYPDFLNFYLDTLMNLGIHGNFNDTMTGIRQGMRVYLTYKDYRGLLDTVNKHFADTKELESQLKKGFQYMKYYYRDYTEPGIVYMVSYLNNWGAFTLGTGTLAIGLDMFLGAGFPYYRSVGIPAYMGTKLEPEYIPVAAMRAVYQERLPFNADNKNLLEMMLQKGKELYFVSKVLPFIPETVRFGYTQKQLDWCNANEALIYNFFIHEDLFYNIEQQKVLRYVTDGPTSAGMPAESPGNVGSWMGYKIVKAYMQQHPQTTLPQLLNEHGPAQQFLQQSKYKPK